MLRHIMLASAMCPSTDSQYSSSHGDCGYHSPVWRDWSYDVGESAVVVMDKRRHARGMWVLEQLMSPSMYKDAFNQTYGDKVGRAAELRVAVYLLWSPSAAAVLSLGQYT